MSALKIFLLSILVITTAAGCSKDESDEKPLLPKITYFKGTPRNFNGYWKGPGSITSGKNKIDNLTYHVEISNTPAGLDLEITANTSTGSNIFYIVFEDHVVYGNQIFDKRDNMLVGSIGTDGFSLARTEIGELVARLDASGALTLNAFMIDEGKRYEFQAVIKK